MSIKEPKYNLNDWGKPPRTQSQSESHIPMIESKSYTNNKYNALSNNNDNNYSIEETNDDSNTINTNDDLRETLSLWQYKYKFTYEERHKFKICAEVLYALFLILILLTFCGSVIGVWYGGQIVLNGIDHNIEDMKQQCFIFGYNQSICYYKCDGNNNQCQGEYYQYYAKIPNLCGNDTVKSEYKCPSSQIDFNYNTSITCYLHNCESEFSFDAEERDKLLGGIVIICVCTGFILVSCFAWYKSCKSCSIS